jgi:nitroreductase
MTLPIAWAIWYDYLMSMPSLDLYGAILARRSVRRYDKEPLDEPTLSQVRQIASGVEPLVPENQFQVILRDAPPGTDLASDLGGYGRMVNPPHYLVPYVLGQEHALEDAGYRVEQISVRLAAMGIGSCFIGALRREDKVRARCSLPEAARIGAFLVFGHPSTSLGGRATNRLLRSASGASRNLAETDFYFEGSFENPATPSGRMAPLIEAARHAPSAVNAQPWRLLWVDESLYIFVTTDNRRYGRGPQQAYRLHDGGAAMANITLAMEALKLSGRWELVEETGPDVPKHATNLQPLARLSLEGMG